MLNINKLEQFFTECRDVLYSEDTKEEMKKCITAWESSLNPEPWLLNPRGAATLLTRTRRSRSEEVEAYED